MFPPTSSLNAFDHDPRTAFYVPIGAASPLWFLFAGATTAGLAYWWMTRLPTLATNLEALFEPAASPEVALPTPEPAPTAPDLLAEAAPEMVPVATVVEEADTESKPPKAAKPKAPPAEDLPLTH